MNGTLIQKEKSTELKNLVAEIKKLKAKNIQLKSEWIISRMSYNLYEDGKIDKNKKKIKKAQNRINEIIKAL